MYGKTEYQTRQEVFPVYVQDKGEEAKNAHDGFGITAGGHVDGHGIVQRDHHTVLHRLFVYFHSLQNDERQVSCNDVKEREKSFAEGWMNEVVREQKVSKQGSVTICVAIVWRLSLKIKRRLFGHFIKCYYISMDSSGFVSHSILRLYS